LIEDEKEEEEEEYNCFAGLYSAVSNTEEFEI